MTDIKVDLEALFRTGPPAVRLRVYDEREQQAYIKAYAEHMRPFLRAYVRRVNADTSLTPQLRAAYLDQTVMEADEAAALFGWIDPQRVYQLTSRALRSGFGRPKTFPVPDQIVGFSALGQAIWAWRRGRLLYWGIPALRLRWDYRTNQVGVQQPSSYGAPKGVGRSRRPRTEEADKAA